MEERLLPLHKNIKNVNIEQWFDASFTHVTKV